MSAPATKKSRATWFPGLDGLRALAVIAVVVYHFNPTVMPGGFLGVDLFFAISGYLITRLLLNQIHNTGRLGIAEFYRRRVRRLLPAVLVLAAVVTAADLLFWRDELATLRSSVASGVFFVANWWLIGDKQSYFVASGRPSMLQHLWSLAIEEQFYLIWPLLLCLIIAPALLRRRGPVVVLRPRMLTRLSLAALLLGLASTGVMALLALRGDVPYGSDSSRIYFGTDTHSMGLFLGAAMGAYASRAILPGARRRRVLRGAFLTDLVGLAALLVMARCVLEVNEFQPALYRGGFLGFSAAAVIVVAAVVRPGSLLGWVLERRPMRWIGQRSYSIYLWHWPVAVVTRPGVDVEWSPVPLFLARVAVTLLLAEASYRFVEVPVRAGALHRFYQRLMADRPDAPAGSTARVLRRRVLPLVAFIGLLTFSSLSSSLAYSSPSVPTSAALRARAVSASPVPGIKPAAAGVTTFPLNIGGRPQSGDGPLRAPGLGTPAASTPPRPTTTPVPMPVPKPTHTAPITQPSPLPSPPTPARAIAKVSAFGDSVMLGAAAQLKAAIPLIDVHAVEGRQARAVFAEIAADRAAGKLAPNVVIHTGDNGIVSASDLSAILGQLSDRARVVVVTDRVPKNWQDPNNSVLRRVVKHFPNAVLADWFALSNSHSNWFYKDGLHLPLGGAAQYAGLINRSLCQ
ncbi:peptidoglycan-N-acetylmuramate O-acetyltransferase [Jatrophihabitans sp. GAS493]|uniref:acyltransferase family protein n=1 Tax=Jatrophihabitans sp. GAS493 TaxID=1907575 RepID=UPI000BB6E734|nr:acyltransferase family protein [Jatrophihabitans sp. GAS493]SOD73372.1 peptidoglycan-N-acetylmuramate O-acetyltransferase [Jatrophihabitans sp. GAS493]